MNTWAVCSRSSNYRVQAGDRSKSDRHLCSFLAGKRDLRVRADRCRTSFCCLASAPCPDDRGIVPPACPQQPADVPRGIHQLWERRWRSVASDSSLSEWSAPRTEKSCIRNVPFIGTESKCCKLATKKEMLYRRPVNYNHNSRSLAHDLKVKRHARRNPIGRESHLLMTEHLTGPENVA